MAGTDEEVIVPRRYPAEFRRKGPRSDRGRQAGRRHRRPTRGHGADGLQLAEPGSDRSWEPGGVPGRIGADLCPPSNCRLLIARVVADGGLGGQLGDRSVEHGDRPACSVRRSPNATCQRVLRRSCPRSRTTDGIRTRPCSSGPSRPCSPNESAPATRRCPTPPHRSVGRRGHPPPHLAAGRRCLHGKIGEHARGDRAHRALGSFLSYATAPNSRDCGPRNSMSEHAIRQHHLRLVNDHGYCHSSMTGTDLEGKSVVFE